MLSLIGRKDVISRIFEVLRRQHYGAVLLIAPRGSGKTAVLDKVAKQLGGAKPAPNPWGRCNATLTPFDVVLMDDPQRRCGIDSLYALAEVAVKRGIRYVIATSDPRPIVGVVERPPWATLVGMWNMSKDEFEELYYAAKRQHSNSAPPFEDVWMVTGGNPKLLFAWAKRGWNLMRLTTRLIDVFKLTVRWFVEKGFEEELLRVVEDPDECGRACNLLWLSGLMAGVVGVKVNPDKELGIGKWYGWTAPLFREIVANLVI